MCAISKSSAVIGRQSLDGRMSSQSIKGVWEWLIYMGSNPTYVGSSPIYVSHGWTKSHDIFRYGPAKLHMYINPINGVLDGSRTPLTGLRLNQKTYSL